MSLEDLGIAGAVTVLLKDALMPNLMQTLEGQPAFVHCGPFANIAHGNSSIIADQIALKLGDYVVTESGFGADIGMEKFFDIKCRYSGLDPERGRARRDRARAQDARRRPEGFARRAAGQGIHRGEPRTARGRSAQPGRAHHERAALRHPGGGVPSTASRMTPTPRWKWCASTRRAWARVAAVKSTHWADGGQGAAALAEAVVEACEKPSDFKFLYPLEWTIKQKIEHIAKEIYGADGVNFEPQAEEQIANYEKAGFGKLPICMAKTHLSLSHDPLLKGVPKGFTVPVREVRASVGAGFIYPLIGKMSTMPGLATHPAYMDIDLDLETGKILNLF